MLRIERDSDGCVTTLRLYGRIQSDCIAGICLAMNDSCTRTILDLSEVDLVDIAVVRFLICCENDGIELVQCPPYVSEWIVRERTEEAQHGPSNVD